MNGGGVSKSKYAEAISAALRSELGNSHRAVKTVRRWTGSNERTVRNWISGANGPSGEHLVILARHSVAVMTAFYQLAGRDDPRGNKGQLRQKLLEALELVERG